MSNSTEDPPMGLNETVWENVLRRMSSRKFQTWLILTLISTVALFIHIPLALEEPVATFSGWAVFNGTISSIYSGVNLANKGKLTINTK